MLVQRDEYRIPEMCKKCGHYTDCPEFYECPPMAILKDFDIILNLHEKGKE